MELNENQLEVIRNCARDEESFKRILDVIGVGSKAKYQVLAVDDQEMIVSLVRTAAEMEDCAVTCVTTGQAAVNEVNRKKWDLIFLDIVIPDIDGGEILNVIRRTPMNQDTPVVFVTGLLKPEEEKSLTPRKEKYIGKPFSIEKIRAVTREVLGI